MQAALAQQHAAYYIAQLQEQETGLHNSVTAKKNIQSELANIRAAWHWSVQQGQLALMAQGVGALHAFYQPTGLYYEAIQLLAVALPIVQQASATAPTLASAQAPLKVQARLACYLAEFYRHTGGLADGARLAQEALALGQHLADPALQALAYHELMRLAQFRGDFSNIQTLAEQAYLQAQQADLPLLMAEYLNDLGIAVLAVLDPLTALGHFQKALDLLQGTDNRYLEARVVVNLGCTHLYMHEYQWAWHYLEQARTLHRLLQAQMNILITTILFGDLCMALGRYAAAQAEYEAALAICQTVRSLYWESWLYASYGRLQYLCGDPVAARTFCTRTGQVAQQGGATFQQRWALIYLGYVLVDWEEWAAADHAYRQAIALQQQSNLRYRTADAYAGLAMLALRQNKVADALHTAETALTLLAEHGVSAAKEPFQVYWVCVRVLQAAADPRADGVLRTAYQRLQEHAAQLTDAAARHAFLHTVANHNLITAAHAAGLA